MPTNEQAPPRARRPSVRLQKELKSLPDPEGLGFDWPALTPLLEEHRKYVSEFNSRKPALEDLKKRQLHGAKAADQEQRAEAYRAGEKDPGEKNAEKVEKEIAETEDTMRMASTTVAAIEGEIISTATEYQKQWLEEVRAEREAAAERMAESLAEFAAARERYAELGGLEEWVEHRPASYRPHTPPGGNLYSQLADAMKEEVERARAAD